MAARRAALATTIALVSFALVGLAHGGSRGVQRVTVFGDSAATAMAYDPEAKRILGRGVELRLEVAACRRVGDTSCPYEGVTPPNVIDRASELGKELGPTVVVIAGYNDYESHYAKNIDDAMTVFRNAGVERVLWATLRAVRQSYANMNDMILAAARKYPELTVLDWNGLAAKNPGWLQPDGIHLTTAGAEGMATMVDDTLMQLGIAAKPEPPRTRRLLAIAPQKLPVGHPGRLYVTRLKAKGGSAPYRWARTAGKLPPGLRLTAGGRLTGVPHRAGTFRLRVRVMDRLGTARARVFSLRVAAV